MNEHPHHSHQEAPAPQPKQSFAIPIAIVLAGALVGAGIFLSGGKAPATGQYPAKQQSSEIALKPISSADHLVGSAAAPITLVEYSDTECPFCKNFHTTARQLMDLYSKDGKLSWVYRHFPIAQLHPKAHKEAQASECAADQGKFWEYVNKVFEVTPSNNGLDAAQLPQIAKDLGLDVAAFNSCFASTKHVAEIDQSIADAQAAGANGTPSSFLVLKKPLSSKAASDILAMYARFKLPDGSLPVTINDKKNIVGISGALPYDYIKGTIDIILQ